MALAGARRAALDFARLPDPLGEADATRATFQAIHDGRPTPELLAYQYLQALPKLADGQGMTLMMVPSDAMPAMGAVSALGAGFQAGQDATASVPTRDSKELGTGSNERTPERDR